MMHKLRLLLTLVTVLFFATMFAGCFRAAYVVADDSERGGVWIVGQRGMRISDEVYRCADLSATGTPQPVCVRSRRVQAPQ